jgi:hypothetical protein
MIDVERRYNALYRGVFNYGTPRESQALKRLGDLLAFTRRMLGHPKHRELCDRIAYELRKMSKESRSLVAEALGMDGKPWMKRN